MCFFPVHRQNTVFCLALIVTIHFWKKSQTNVSLYVRERINDCVSVTPMCVQTTHIDLIFFYSFIFAVLFLFRPVRFAFFQHTRSMKRYQTVLFIAVLLSHNGKRNSIKICIHNRLCCVVRALNSICFFYKKNSWRKKQQTNACFGLINWFYKMHTGQKSEEKKWRKFAIHDKITTATIQRI